VHLKGVERVGRYTKRAIFESDPRKLLLVHRLHDDTSGNAQTPGRLCRKKDLHFSHSTPPSSRPNLPWRIRITVASSSLRAWSGTALAQRESGILKRLKHTQRFVEVERDGARNRVISRVVGTHMRSLQIGWDADVVSASSFRPSTCATSAVRIEREHPARARRDYRSSGRSWPVLPGAHTPHSV